MWHGAHTAVTKNELMKTINVSGLLCFKFWEIKHTKSIISNVLGRYKKNIAVGEGWIKLGQTFLGAGGIDQIC